MKTIKFYIAVTVILSSGCRNETVKNTTSEVPGIRKTHVVPESVSIPVHSTGMLVSSEEMKLSFKTGGIVADIPVREGDRVRKGEILSTLNLAEINAQVSLAGNAYDKALRDYSRVKNLFADSVATLEQVQNAATALNVAKSSLDIAQFNLTHSKIIAPDNGIILKQFVKVNELISSGYPVFLFGSSGKNWKIKAGLSDRDVVRVNPGDSAIITFDAWPGIKFPAIVDQVGEISNPLTGTYQIEMSLERSDYRLASGFVAGVEIFPSKKETYIMVPVEAIVEADGETGYIFTVTDSMTASKIKINIVTIIGSKAAIRTNSGEIGEIVSEGAAYLREGDKVKIIK